MPISLIPKKRRQRRISINFGLIKENKQTVFVAGILILVFVIYGALVFYEGILRGEASDIQAKIKNFEKHRDADKENAVLAFDAKLTKLSSILDNHIYSSGLFAFIEGITHPKVQFINFSFSADEGKLTLNGITESYETFGEQIIALELDEKLRDIVILDVKLQKTGQVEFSIAFKADESIYR
ncbi:MAG: hypothetical protein WAP23_02045 [Candidatus Spechtbacterales bacterium]